MTKENNIVKNKIFYTIFFIHLSCLYLHNNVFACSGVAETDKNNIFFNILTILSILISIFAIFFAGYYSHKTTENTIIFNKKNIQIATMKKFVAWYVKFIDSIECVEVKFQGHLDLFCEIKTMFCKQTFELYDRLLHYMLKFNKWYNAEKERVIIDDLFKFDEVYNCILDMMCDEINSNKVKYKFISSNKYKNIIDIIHALSYLDDK